MDVAKATAAPFRLNETCSTAFRIWLNFFSVKRPAFPSASAVRWGKKLAAEVAVVMARYPDADPDDVRLTLIALQSPPLVRLNRSLRRGRGFAAFRK
ncbi:MAG: hypothetical protein ABSE16_00815 [Verrucomicrobiota bacterium]